MQKNCTNFEYSFCRQNKPRKKLVIYPINYKPIVLFCVPLYSYKNPILIIFVAYIKLLAYKFDILKISNLTFET